MRDLPADERRGPPHRQLPGRSGVGRPGPAAVLRRPRHLGDAALDPGALRGRDRHPDRRPRPARRGLGRGRRQGARARRGRDDPRRRPGGVRPRLRAPGDQGERALRRRLSAVHGARAAADREARGRARPRQRLRHDRPRLHRQGQRPGADRRHDRRPRSGAQGAGAGARVEDGTRGGDRLRARARDPDQGGERGRGAVLDRRQPLGALVGGALDRGPGGAHPRRRLHSSSPGPRRHPTSPSWSGSGSRPAGRCRSTASASGWSS